MVEQAVEVEHRCWSCGQFSGAGHACPPRTQTVAAAVGVYGEGAYSRAHRAASAAGGDGPASQEDLEDALTRTRLAADSMLAQGDLSAQQHQEATERLESGWQAVRSGEWSSIGRRDVEALRSLADQGPSITPQARVIEAQERARRASVEAGLVALKHRRGAADRAGLEQAIARREEAQREVLRAQASIAATASEVADPGPGEQARCSECGQYSGPGHICPMPEGMPSGSYKGMPPKERTEQMLADVQASVAAVVESGQLHQWLDAMASNGLNRWSLNNRMLALVQLSSRREGGLAGIGDAHMMGFRQWEKMGRHVNKGEQAIWILAPMKRKIERKDPLTGEVEFVPVVTGFKSVPVFDISQTRGKPLPAAPLSPPEGEATPGTLTGLRDRVAAAGFTYRETEIPDCDPKTGTGTQGYTAPDPQEVVIDSRLSSAHKASVLAHELGHIHCEHLKEMDQYRQHRGRMETEAEMTAYMVNRARGMDKKRVDSFSPGYIATWSQGNSEVITGAMDRAVKAFNKIMDGAWPLSDSKGR